DAGGQAASSRTLLQEEQRAAGSVPAGSAYSIGTFHSAGPSAGVGDGAAAVAQAESAEPEPQPHSQKHGLVDSPAARALLKLMDKLEKSNEAMLELLRSLVAASSTKD
ncbi:unnamed protein product, partial [Tilletia controversa]